jgi:hypothetical protein
VTAAVEVAAAEAIVAAAPGVVAVEPIAAAEGAAVEVAVEAEATDQ